MNSYKYLLFDLDGTLNAWISRYAAENIIYRRK